MRIFMLMSCALLFVYLGFMATGSVALTDEEQIVEIVRGAAEAYENEDIDKVMSYFSEDCERRVVPASGEAITFTGKEAVRATFLGDFGKWDDIELIVTNIVVTISGDTATATSDAENYLTNLDNEGIREIVTQKFNVNLGKIEDAWKITVLENVIESWKPVSEVSMDGLITDTITSLSLEGNPLGNPATRDLLIYLPPSYDTSDRRYPVVCMVPYGRGAGLEGIADVLDDLMTSGQVKEIIVVIVDGSSKYGASWYTNSELNGNYEAYVVQDIVGHIDANYRTIAGPDSRGILGGPITDGYGAIVLAMKYPGVFGAVACPNATLVLEAARPLAGAIIAENPDGMMTPEQALGAHDEDVPRRITSYLYAMAAAFSPNLENPPTFVDLILEWPSPEIIETAWARWMEHDPLTMLNTHAASLASLRGLYIECATPDPLGKDYMAEVFHQALDAAGIKHEYQVYPADPEIGLSRLNVMMPFLSDALLDEGDLAAYTNVFFASLSPGLNMISLPLEPLIPYTARSFAEELSATVVIKYDETLGKFVGFSPQAPDDGFPIEGGKGYIVNVPGGGVVPFVGAAWTNDSPVDMAPPVKRSNTAWAFVVSGSVDAMSVLDNRYTVIVKNLRTGTEAAEATDSSGYFAAAYADLSRNAVVKVGDEVEIAVMDSSGNIVSGPHTREITLEDIRDAVVNVRLKLGHIIPDKSVLLQNYPNPFNPETWIPYHLKDQASVVIRIHTAAGQLVRTLDLGHREAGVYGSRSRAAYWDGKSEAGEQVASGIYFYTMTAGDFSAMRKMIIRK